MRTESVAHLIASRCEAIRNCQKSNNKEWEDKHSEVLDYIERNLLPSGAGIDNGTKIDRNASNSEKVILTFSFHHMDDNGFYACWSDYKAIIKPSWDGALDVTIFGRNMNGIKEHLHEVFDCMLNVPCIKLTGVTLF